MRILVILLTVRALHRTFAQREESDGTVYAGNGKIIVFVFVPKSSTLKKK
jgi:hypothetical protein